MMSLAHGQCPVILHHQKTINMKKILIIGFILISTLISNAQTDTSKVEQYCQVIATPRLLSNKVTIDIDLGDEKSFWRDTRLKTDGGALRKFNTIIDALNYMGREGWIFINAYPVHMGQTDIFHFAFKKLFPKSELL
jgi:hypothetical protein